MTYCAAEINIIHSSLVESFHCSNCGVDPTLIQWIMNESISCLLSAFLSWESCDIRLSGTWISQTNSPVKNEFSWLKHLSLRQSVRRYRAMLIPLRSFHALKQMWCEFEHVVVALISWIHLSWHESRRDNQLPSQVYDKSNLERFNTVRN